MRASIKKTVYILFAMALASALASVLCACSGKQASESIRIGTMPTEDILPIWVAEQEGLFEEAGIDAEVVVFDSAQSLSAAITSGDVDIAMTDPMRAVKLYGSGCDLEMDWITLGAEAGQGRFGVLASADSGIESLSDLTSSEKGVGVAANTVPEYVFDGLCARSGIDPESIVTSEVASLPDRYGLVAAGQLDAAALPGSMLALGEASGMVVIADDASGDNLSQSVMVVRTAYLEQGGVQTLEKVREIWNEAASSINSDPEAYRSLLVEKANLNDAVASTYPISEYPLATSSDGTAAHPSAALVDPVLAWMKDKGYTDENIVYDEATGTFSAE